jgi:phosphate-selective porin OprO/OprP
MPLTHAVAGRVPGLLARAAIAFALLSSPMPAVGQVWLGPATVSADATLISASFATQEAPASGTRKKTTWGFEWKDHPTLLMGIVRIGFRARIQQDKQSSDAAISREDELTADVARKRIGLEGEVVKYADFQLERELGDDLDPWRDVYVNYRQFDALQFQYGKFKLPLGLEENTSATSIDFVNRSLAANTLAPGRDIGFMMHGRVLAKTIGYEYGRFEHDGRNAKPKNATDRVIGGTTQAVRLSIQPFRGSKSVASEFEVGIALTSSDVPEGFSGLRGQTVLGSKFYTADYLVRGPRKRMGLEARWRPGPVSVQAEYIKATDERRGESVEDTDLRPIRSVGWYLSGTWAVTGDRKAGGLENSKHPLGKGGVGAVEIAARIERLTFDSEATGDIPTSSVRSTVIIGNSDRVLTLGVNWYPIRWVRIQFNLIRETLADPSLGPLPSQPSFSSRVVRFQFSL